MLVGMLSTMVLLAFVQIVYRNLFGGGVAWIDPFLRMLVLWVALTGAIIATRSNNHIRIDVLSRSLSPRWCRVVGRMVYAYCLVICALIAWFSVGLVTMDYVDATMAFAHIPAWQTELIIPISFAMMAFRYLLFVILPPKQGRAAC